METQPETTLLELIRYNNWANSQVLAACQNLDTDQLSATTPGTYGTIRDTLEHIIRAEADYVGRLTGDRPQPSFKWEDHPALVDLLYLRPSSGWCPPGGRSAHPVHRHRP